MYIEYSCVGTLIIFSLLAGMIFLFYIGGKGRSAINIKNSEAEYKKALSELRMNPSSPELAQKTIQAARAYSKTTRATAFGQLADEDTLMKEINSVISGEKAIAQNTISGQTIEERLAKLTDLKNKNMITPEEYEARKKTILDEI